MTELIHKLGPHVEWPGKGIDLKERWKPAACLLMNVEGDVIQRVRNASPSTFVIVRKTDGKGWRDKDPVDWADEVFHMVRTCPPDAVVADNEPLGHDETHLFAAFDQWQAAFISRMRQHGVETGGFSFGEGNFTRDGPNIVECFPDSINLLKYVFIHEYWKPRYYSEKMHGYHCLRWPYWLEWFDEAGRWDIQIVVTEFGMTMAVGGGPDVGYLSDEARAAGITREAYLDDVSQYHAVCCQELRVLACLPFNWYAYGKFASFEHAEDPYVTEAIINMRAPGEIPEEPPDPPPPEPPPEEPMDIKVKDLEYNWQPFSYAEEKYGVAYRRAEVASGQKVYRLTELWEKSGNSSLVSKVLDEDGKPMANVDVAFYWPDAPDPPDPPTEVYDDDWHSNFIHGPTNAEGEVGPGMGHGAYHGRGEGGPHATWVRDPAIPSDICEKLGMLAGTPHDHLDQVYELMVEGEGPEPPPVTGQEGTFVKTAKAWQPGGANSILIVPENHDLYEMRGNLGVGDGWEIPDLVEPIEEDDGPRLKFDTSYGEQHEEDRTYWATIVYRPTMKVVGGPWDFEYQAGQLGMWTLTARWIEDGEPPPSGEVEQRVEALEGDMEALKDALRLFLGE